MYWSVVMLIRRFEVWQWKGDYVASMSVNSFRSHFEDSKYREGTDYCFENVFKKMLEIVFLKIGLKFL